MRRRPTATLMVFGVLALTGHEAFSPPKPFATPLSKIGPGTVVRSRSSLRRRTPVFAAPRVQEAGLEDLAAATKLCIEVFFGQPKDVWPWQRPQLQRLQSYQRADLSLRHRPARVSWRRRVAMFKVLDDDDKTMIGFVEVMEKVPGGTYTLSYDDPNRDAKVFAANLAVAKSARRRGIGQALLAQAEEAARGWGFSELYVQVDEDNTNACKFYDKLGFRFLLLDPAARRFCLGGVFLGSETVPKLTLWRSISGVMPSWPFAKLRSGLSSVVGLDK